MSTQTTPSIGDRMKVYENVTRNHLIRRMPVIIRLDGKAFHTYTRGLERPFDSTFRQIMADTAKFLLDETQGAVIAYTQSDEISLFLRDYDRLVSEAWFDNNIQKMVSVSASMASAYFNDSVRLFARDAANERFKNKPLAFFDARAFNLPKEEVINYFIWRQQDTMRNSVQTLGQEYLPNTHGLNNKEVQAQLLKLNPPIDWGEFPDFFKYGTTIFKDDGHIPAKMPTEIFKDNRDFLNNIIYLKDKE